MLIVILGMGILYIVMAVIFLGLVITNLMWLAINISIWMTNGLQFILEGMNFTERIYYSIFLKWVLLADVAWLVAVLGFAIKRKHYKTDINLHYLKFNPIKCPSIAVVIPTFNEEEVISKVVSDFINQKNVKDVFVVDNKSTDKTVEIAKKLGAKVIQNKKNMGLAYSVVTGFKEALKSESDIIALVEGDGTCSAYDLEKMIPYLDNSDMVVGTRQLQVLSEKGNQNKMIYVWAHYYLAKLIQIKFFSLLHRGVVSFTDVGCMYRSIRKEALEKIIDEFIDKKTGKVIPGLNITVFISIVALQKDLRVIELPISFKKRQGISKTGSNKILGALKIGWEYVWFIVKS
jgi:dolichol-phosphate hexosyltransferase